MPALPDMDRRSTFWLLLLPPAAWLAAFFVLPLLMTALFSFRPDMKGGLLSFPAPSLEQYAVLARTPSYLRLLGISTGIAVLVAAAATALAYPIAYFISFRAGAKAPLYLLLLLVPFWTSYLLRVMAWKLVLGSNGLINSVLLTAGLREEPLSLFLYSRSAVGLTLTYVWIPFAALPILAALQRIESPVMEAAFDLGATPLRRFWRVVFPLSLPGVVASFFMVFIPTVGEYVTPLLVGGSRGSLYGNIVQDFFTKAANWPLGSALSMVMLTTTIAWILLAARWGNFRQWLA